MAKSSIPKGLMTAKEVRASLREFNKRPGEAAKLKAIRAKNKEPGRITRGPNKGLMKGTGKG